MRIEDEFTLEVAEELESELERHVDDTFDQLKNSDEAKALYEFVEEKRDEIDNIVAELQGRVVDIYNVFERTGSIEEKVQNKYYEILELEPKFSVGDTVYKKYHSTGTLQKFTVVDFLHKNQIDKEQNKYMLRSEFDVQPFWIVANESELSY